MIDEALVDKITARVLALVNGEPVDLSAKNVLMLFSGASTGFVAGMEAIKRLAHSPHGLTVVLTPSAGHIITTDKVRAAGARNIIQSHEWVNAPALVKQSNLVLIPTLSMNLAARLALGLMDSLVCTLTLGALLAGKAVVAVEDGADPNGPGGLVFGATEGTAPALRAQLSGHLTALRAYGMELVREQDFLLTMERRLLTGAIVSPAPPVTGSGQKDGQVKNRLNGGAPDFITESDLLTLSPESTLHLSPGSRLTPQAQDTARRLNLNIVVD
jgi:hypothetical protein